MDTVDNAITKPVHRLEVFTGAGRRRSFSDKDEAGIVAEIATSGESVCAVARRHGLSPQQLLAGDVGCENLRLGLLRRMDCSLCPRWWMLPHRHLPLAVNAISRRARRSLVPERSRSRSMA